MDRLVRLAALAPALAAFAASILRRQLRARGESRALSLSGAHPLRQTLGLALGGAMIGVPAALAGVLFSPSLRALLPTLTASPWRAISGGFFAPALGIFLEDHGNSIHYTLPAPEPGPQPARWTIALALALASVLAPWWASQPCSWRARVGVGTGAVLGAIVAFHRIALGGSGALLWLPCVLLLGHLLIPRRDA